MFSTIPIIQNISQNDKFEKKFRNHSIDNISKLRENISKSLEYFSAYDNLPIDDRLLIFMHIIQKTYNSSIPIMTKKISHKRLFAPWITNSLKKCIDRKHRLYRASRNDPSLFD